MFLKTQPKEIQNNLICSVISNRETSNQLRWPNFLSDFPSANSMLESHRKSKKPTCLCDIYRQKGLRNNSLWKFSSLFLNLKHAITNVVGFFFSVMQFSAVPDQAVFRVPVAWILQLNAESRSLHRIQQRLQSCARFLLKTFRRYINYKICNHVHNSINKRHTEGCL